jgi:hypothetical protein
MSLPIFNLTSKFYRKYSAVYFCFFTICFSLAMAAILNGGWDFTHNSESGTAKFISTQESEDTILMSLIFSSKYAS